MLHSEFWYFHHLFENTYYIRISWANEIPSETEADFFERMKFMDANLNISKSLTGNHEAPWKFTIIPFSLFSLPVKL